MQNEKMVLDLNCSEMWTPERGHSKQMEGEQGNIERIMIWLGSCSDSTLAASWVLSGLEVSLQRWVSRRDDEADSVVDASDVGRTFTSLVHKGLWTVETADIALGLSQHYHAVRMFICTKGSPMPTSILRTQRILRTEHIIYPDLLDVVEATGLQRFLHQAPVTWAESQQLSQKGVQA